MRDWRIWGIAPRSSDGLRYRVLSTIVHSVIWFFITCQWLSLINAGTIPEIIDVIILATTFVLAYIKAAIAQIHRKKINDIVLVMKHLELGTAERPMEQECLREAENRSRFLYKLMAGVCFAGVTLFSIQPLLNGHQLMYTSLYPFDWDATRTRYYATFFFQVTCNYFIVAVIPAVDTYGPAMWSFLAAYIDVLRSRLHNLGSAKGASDRDHEKELVECVRYHVHLIQ